MKTKYCMNSEFLKNIKMFNNINKISKFTIINIFIILYLNLLINENILKNIHKITKIAFIDSSFYFYNVLHLKYFIFIFTTFAIFYVISYKKLSWINFENYKIIRVFILILTFSIFWEICFFEYNYFLDTDMFFDKLLLLILFLAIFYNPLFVIPFLFQALISLQSLMFALGNFHWTGVRPAYELLILFVVFMIVKRFRVVHTNIFILLAITLHVANYFIPGIAKIEISPNGWEWTFLNELNNLFISSYVNGWLGFLSEELIISIAQLLDKTEVLVTVGTMIIQLGALFLFYSRRISIAFFIGFELLHLGIFFASGIFFWAWIIVNLGFIYLVKNLPENDTKLLFSKTNFYVFIVIVLLSPIFYKPIALGWWDGRINVVYDFYATTKDNKIFKLNRNDFSPYDEIFSQNRFYYADKDKIPHNAFGSIARDDMNYAETSKTRRTNDSYELYLAYENARNIDEIQIINKNFGKTFYNEKRKNNLENFIKIYFTNYNKVEQKHSWYHKLGAPYHIYDLSAKRLQGGEKIEKVEVYKTYTWWNKEEAKIVRFGEEKVMEVDIEAN